MILIKEGVWGFFDILDKFDFDLSYQGLGSPPQAQYTHKHTQIGIRLIQIRHKIS